MTPDQTQTPDNALAGNKWRRRTGIAGGVVYLIFGLLVFVVVVRDFVLASRYLITGNGLVGSYIEGVADAILAAVFLLLGWLLTRKLVAKEKVRQVFWIGFAIAVVYGIIRGFQ